MQLGNIKGNKPSHKNRTKIIIVNKKYFISHYLQFLAITRRHINTSVEVGLFSCNCKQLTQIDLIALRMRTL